jgi:hypothetical protein
MSPFLMPAPLQRGERPTGALSRAIVPLEE